MDLRYAREVTVGTIVIVAIVIFIIGTMWLSGRSISSRDLIRIQFSDVSGLKQASPVRVSGVAVGRVEDIHFVDVGRVLVGVSLPEKIRPKIDASAQITAISLVGDYAVDFNPGQASQLLPPERVILGTQEIGLADRAVTLSQRTDSLLIGAQTFVNQKTADQLYATLAAVQGTLAAAERTMRVYGNPDRGPTAEISKTLISLRQLTSRFDSTLANPALSRTLQRMDTLTSNLARMTNQLAATGARLDSVLAKVERGDGTIGKFATDTSLYRNLVGVTASMDSLLTQLKREPGRIGVTVKLF